jgi:nucleotide-binding universal stress UspA family protein
MRIVASPDSIARLLAWPWLAHDRACVDAATSEPTCMAMTTAREARSAGPVILCYDGSNEAAEAIAYAGELLPGSPAVVVGAWQPIIEEALSTAMTPPVTDPVEANPRERTSAEQFAAKGAQLASEAGLWAEPLVVEAEGPLWEAVELLAEERNAKLIVCGTDRSGVRAALPGNLASALVTHASRPVLVVPSAQAAAERIRDVQEKRSSRHTLSRAVAVAAVRAKQMASAARARSRVKRR